MSDISDCNVKIIFTQFVRFDQQLMDSIMAAIREAVADRDVIIIDPQSRPQE